MKILVSGLINIETNAAVRSFPVEYSPIEYAFNGVSVDLSGVAYNIIKALNVLGDTVFPVSVIGKDIVGAMIKNELESLGISTENLFEKLDKTCTSAILFDESGRRKVFCDLKNIQDLVLPYSSLENKVKEADGLVVCNINFNDELIHKAKESGKPVFTDVHVLSDINDGYNKRFLENADIVFLSDEGISGNHEDFLVSIWEKYRNRAVVLGQGKAGAMILDGKKRCVKSIASVNTRPVLNTVGAGDSLFSSFVHFYLKGLEPTECLKKAVTFAGWKIGESGGAKGFLSEKELENLCRGIEYTEVRVKEF